MKKLLLAVREFVEDHRGELAQDPELRTMLRWLEARLKEKNRPLEKGKGPRVRWLPRF